MAYISEVEGIVDYMVLEKQNPCFDGHMIPIYIQRTRFTFKVHINISGCY